MLARIGVRASAAAAAMAVLALLAGPAAEADSTGDPARDLLMAANQATWAAAETGIDVEQVVTVDGRTSLRQWFTPYASVTVPAGSQVRVHSTVMPDGTSYTSLRYLPSGRLIGAAGVDPASRERWATVSMLAGEYRARALSRGARDRTALVGIADPRILRDSQVVDRPMVMALRLILPPYSASMEEGWTTVSTQTRWDGAIVISGTIQAGVPASDGEDTCVRPSVELVVGPDLVAREATWVENCPDRPDRDYHAVATFGDHVVKPPTRPRMSAARALG
jgi:hypothetical protein